MQIKAKKLRHVFDKKTASEFLAIDNVNATISQGEFIAIIGHTGSGKTTFVEHLNGLLIPTDGEVEITLNEKMTEEETKAIPVTRKGIHDNVLKITNKSKRMRNIKRFRKKVGIVFQFAEYQLFEETILKDIIFGPISMGVPKDKAIELAKKFIKIVGMSEEFLSRSPFELSGGQKRRVALAGVLAMEPDILIFDEPTAGLDPEGIEEMYKIFRELHANGKTLITVTHNLDEVLRFTKRTMLFKKGKLVVDGNSSDILYDFDLINDNDLQVPKIVSLVRELEAKGIKVGKPTSIREFVEVFE